MVPGHIAKNILKPTIMNCRKILVCSIGNPEPYLNTRHSAGHTMSELLRDTFGYGPFGRNRVYGGVVSFPTYNQPYTFFQSGSFMNLSGKPVKTAWNQFLRGLEEEEKENAVLVVLHDELEVALGKVKVKKSGSAGGHNGLVSCIQQLQTKDFLRIGIGIGRPESRDAVIVSKYVLGRMAVQEKKVLEEKSLPLVIAELEKIARLP